MSTPFADIQSRIASAVTRHLADATADFGAGLLIDGLFREPYAEAFNGFVSGNLPTFEAESSSLAGIVRGATVNIRSVNYTVKEIHPDGQGMTVIDLESV